MPGLVKYTAAEESDKLQNMRLLQETAGNSKTY